MLLSHLVVLFSCPFLAVIAFSGLAPFPPNASDWQPRQRLISLAINESLTSLLPTGRGGGEGADPSIKDASAMHDACHSLHGTPEFSRLGCCQPQDVRILYNVQFDVKSLAFFGEEPFSPLPTVRLVRRHGETPAMFSLPIRRHKKEAFRTRCSTVWDGTLHVFGRSITHNVFHATVDNFLPLAAQIAQDAHFASPFLHRPRAFLTSLQPGSDPIVSSANGSSSSDATPHMKLVRDLFSAGPVTLRELHGVCVARIVWNAGIRALYHNTLVAMRRSVSDFARSFVLHVYKLQTPAPFAPKHLQPGPAGDAASSSLRIVVYTRGFTGFGRSIPNEGLLVARLSALGHRAVLCCNFSQSTVTDQLALAAHADVIIGLHGAALVHAIFSPRGVHVVELKSSYGYSTSLFALVSDSREGLHSHLDIRGYQLKSGHAAIDGPLVARVVKQITLARSGNVTSTVLAAGPGPLPNSNAIPPPAASTPDTQAAHSRHKTLPSEARPGLHVAKQFSTFVDRLTPPTLAPPQSPLSHFLGPPVSLIRSLCRITEVYRYQASVSEREGEGDELHCAVACAQYKDRSKY